MNTIGIESSVKDDSLLNEAVHKSVQELRNKYLSKLPDNWNIECGKKNVSFRTIKKLLTDAGMPASKVNDYYGLDCNIVTDSDIVYLTIKTDDKIIRKPLFLGEMKKQGTNDRRIKEGKKKQAVGNAGPDRVAKNYMIAADYCALSDKEFFPYNVYLHGCDFKDNEITKTTKSKLEPFFGKLNNVNPWFDKDMFMYTSSHKGGSCFYQNEDFTVQWLYEKCYECCRIGIEHYLEKYK